MPLQTNIKKLSGTLTTDGAGAASTDLTTSGYKLYKVNLNSGDPTGGGANLTGGTLKAQDNAGAGTIHATVTPSGAGNTVEKALGSGVAVTNTLRISVSGGGATKKCGYSVWLVAA